MGSQARRKCIGSPGCVEESFMKLQLPSSSTTLPLFIAPQGDVKCDDFFGVDFTIVNTNARPALTESFTAMRGSLQL